ncbi:MAG TPA: ACP S-malonyltransferase [Candidatus Omnitrophota bacterium]|nr:ACP S-malonyltransferase [Candidatus Omnitrophota bacterium]HPW64859.1 ACP S-malonyltransferase [Candidatus Omnitrophota bacterium]HQB94086.1 ACP S-malonyltransferase [Candidatus Omnitrophota bacterium]
MQKIGFLFPGQGAQSVGMGKDLFEQSAAARAVYEKADTALGYSLSKICFEGPEPELTRTLYAQAAIFVTSMAALAALHEKLGDLRPALTAGLSLGEFSALAAAKAISFEDALELIRVRAEAMEAAAQQNPGTMASVMGLDIEGCKTTALEAGCEIANLNTPEQTVLSGTKESIEKACKIAEAKGAKRAIPLKVGGAFHSSLMKPAQDRLEAALKNTEIREPACVFIPNVTAQKVSEPAVIRDLLAKQLTSSVQWVGTMAAAKAEGIVSFIEIGPGKVLKGLARKCQPEFQVSNFGAIADLSAIEALNLIRKS